jgi:hypothetical protein
VHHGVLVAVEHRHTLAAGRVPHHHRWLVPRLPSRPPRFLITTATTSLNCIDRYGATRFQDTLRSARHVCGVCGRG